jgi:PST family polysaccharide transporter
MIGQRTALSSSLMVGARLLSRVIDLGIMLILARLLSPADFGLVAIAMTIVSILEAALELPLSQALVRLPEIKHSYYDTAFTLSLIRGVLLCGAICALAVPFARYYHHPELVPLMQALSLAPAARGMQNPRLAEYAKALNFKYEFYFELTGKTTAFVIGATTAWLTHSYWSIALCTITAPLMITVLTYGFIPYRPRLTLADWRLFHHFLGWISLSQMALAFNWQSDQLLLGKLMRPAELGLFSTASNITAIPMAALFSPMLRPLLSAFTMVKDEPERLRASYQTAASAVVAIGLPILAGQSAVAAPMVMVLLGAKWVGAIPLVRWLSISLIPYVFGVLLTPLGMALGQTREMALRDIFQLLVKLPLVIVGAIYYGFAGVVAARLIAETATALFCMASVKRLIGASIAAQFVACSRPIIAVLVMLSGLALLRPWLDLGPGEGAQAAQLLLSIFCGAVIYAGSLMLLWRVAGQPRGFEATAMGIFKSLWIQRRRRTAEV